MDEEFEQNVERNLGADSFLLLLFFFKNEIVID